MSNFVKILLENFYTRQKVFKLERNDKPLIDSFLKEIREDKNLEPELGELYSIVSDAANGLRLPPQKYKPLNLSKKLRYTAYEAKSTHLRLYLMQEKETGMIIIIGGKKTEQKQDLKRIEQIIKEYTLFKQNS